MDLGQRIRQVREKRNISQRQAAMSADICPASWNRLEGKDSNPTYSTLKRVAETLGVPIAMLFFVEVD
ncbi:MAG TPA: hypothetical protein DCE42_12820 [Myxococcales bacterium]|mgnify:CR=1 FL=1|nr:hypothetical protein [Deltaproteobacteria bacterium]MBK07368.1 hypothetical protein [Deltaproteobacteria bacterium]MBU53507.1 hypothetical protein [Deltaproteobacteria bacterium]HAA55637.1 hypothetical protein [Myxococcales bacterium]|tara:strand:+ start:2409 stop:2612 length:204 start_codon:yes stop_codon:yes gene_type:complete